MARAGDDLLATDERVNLQHYTLLIWPIGRHHTGLTSCLLVTIASVLGVGMLHTSHATSVTKSTLHVFMFQSSTANHEYRKAFAYQPYLPTRLLGSQHNLRGHRKSLADIPM